MNYSQLHGVSIFTTPTLPWVKLAGSPTQRGGCPALANFHNFSSQCGNSPSSKKIAPFKSLIVKAIINIFYLKLWITCPF